MILRNTLVMRRATGGRGQSCAGTGFISGVSQNKGVPLKGVI